MKPSRDPVAVPACLTPLILSLIPFLSIEAGPGGGQVQPSLRGDLLFAALILAIVAGLLLLGYLTTFFIFRKLAQPWRDWRVYLSFMLSVVVWGLMGMITGVIPMILMYGLMRTYSRTLGSS